METKQIKSPKDLRVYQKAYGLAMEIFNISKLTDADGENSETDTWLDFARDCGYLATCDHRRLARECRQVGAMIGSMLNNPGPFLIKNIRHPTSDLRHLETNGLKGARKK